MVVCLSVLVGACVFACMFVRLCVFMCLRGCGFVRWWRVFVCLWACMSYECVFVWVCVGLCVFVSVCVCLCVIVVRVECVLFERCCSCVYLRCVVKHVVV